MLSAVMPSATKTFSALLECPNRGGIQADAKNIPIVEAADTF
jgi:hypothetical protein